MNEAPAHPSAVDGAPQAELARLCRQLCLSRENLPPESRPSIDDQLADSLATVRLTYGADAVNSDDLLNLFRIEQNRVADAALLAELIAPRLAQLVQSPLTAAAQTSSSASSAPLFPQTTAPFSPPTPARAASSGPPDIADLLDGMLAQDQAEARERRPSSRK